MNIFGVKKGWVQTFETEDEEQEVVVAPAQPAIVENKNEKLQYKKLIPEF